MIFLASYRNRKIKFAKDLIINKLITELQFATEQSKDAVHCSLSEWIDIHYGSKVLELGCGPGRYVAMLAKLGFHVTAVDPHSFDTWEGLKILQNVEMYDRVYAEELPFPDQTFDHVCCLSSLLYFEDPNKALCEMYRVLKPNGRLLLSALNSENLYTKFSEKKIDPASKNYYTKNEILNFVQRYNFEVVKYFTFGFYSPIFPNFYWYLESVYINNKWQRIMSNLTPERHRVKHIIYAKRA